jgi:inosine triphosphate pyrophosphatase
MAMKEVSGPIVIEDTSLCFNALGGLPGPYIKWFLQKTGHVGLNNLLAAYEDKSARAVCCLSYFDGREGSEPIVFVGETHGKIVPARGKASFSFCYGESEELHPTNIA